MAWSNVHPEAPLDDEGRPIHPEKGYPICGYEKTDAVANNGKKRTDIPYCLQAAGWGTDRDTGHCRKHYGASPGAPEGWRNGNARHLLFSKQMRDEDREVFEAVVKTEDGEMLDVEDMADMLKNSIGWEFTRLQRALEHVPEARLVENWRCPDCGDVKHDPAGHCDNVVYSSPETGAVRCGYEGDYVLNNRFVEFGDKSFERKERHIAALMREYKRLAIGQDVNVTGHHTVEGGDEPLSVNITHARVETPDDEGEAEEADDTDD